MSNSSSFSRDTSNAISLPALIGLATRLGPGLVFAAVIALAAYGFRLLPGLSSVSPMIVAILIGIVIGNVTGTPVVLHPGIAFSMRRLLRLAVILLGVQLTFGQVAETGLRGVAIILACVGSTFVFTLAVGRLIGVDAPLARLIAAGTSICGASAVAAANSVVEADDEDVAYAVACVTLFGSIAMFAYPLLGGLLGLGARDYGLWAGASIHEIAQVVAATFAVGSDAGNFGTIAKLTRVMTLAPLVFAMATLAASARTEGRASRKAPLPWFVLGFVALVAANSVIAIPPGAKWEISLISSFLLTMALAAMGLETSIVKLRARGLRPALLGALASLFIATISIVLIKLT